jgi:NAD(P)-dependent dehydrogenase (short-subunit alcohol dehydrogenase family)
MSQTPAPVPHPRTAIVTGSSSGIGLGIARHFLDLGMSVVLHGRDERKLRSVADRLGPAARIAAVAGDNARRATGEALVQTALDRFGAVDVLVNNAGTFQAKPFVDVTEAELDGFLHGNLRGTYLTSQAAVRAMLQNRRGAIVNIGTVLIDHPIAGVPASAPLISKGGVYALTTSLAAELADRGIRVNMVAPGMVRTPMHPDADAFAELALLDRVGEVTDIAAAVAYLIDATFVTGHVLNVDGGFVTGRPAPWLRSARREGQVAV